MRINTWNARRTLPMSLAIRLIAGLRARGQRCAYRVHIGATPTVTVEFEMTTVRR